jgi:hypothetical protein
MDFVCTTYLYHLLVRTTYLYHLLVCTTYFNFQLTYFIEQSPSWEANRSSVHQEIPLILWNPKVYYRIHKSLSLSWARFMQSMRAHPTSRRSILILSSHLRLVLPSGLLPSGFPTKALYAPLLSPIHATCPAHLSLCLDHPNDIWWGVQSIKLLVM